MVHEYFIRSYSTGTRGRTLCQARNHHFVIDGPEYSGDPGEEITPVEAFLSGIAACAVAMVERLARADGTPLTWTECAIEGTVDRDRQPRENVTLFNTLRLVFRLRGVTDEQASQLIETFKRR